MDGWLAGGTGDPALVAVVGVAVVGVAVPTAVVLAEVLVEAGEALLPPPHAAPKANTGKIAA